MVHGTNKKNLYPFLKKVLTVAKISDTMVSVRENKHKGEVIGNANDNDAR